MTAPTGIRKTLAMLHFALLHCQENQMRRIIVVLPFLTLAEQIEKEHRKIIPDLLVDHSQSRCERRCRAAVISVCGSARRKRLSFLQSQWIPSYASGR